ncbi:hypothetical protein [Embleya sp. NPDC050493]|uniref:hypothetical protein n=1 Tax=Embleya sp. NPDC050493 TaxID=3363989 RepID=UPI003799CFDA
MAVHREEAHIHRELDLPLGVAENIANESLVPGEERRTDEALATWRRALALFTEEGDLSGVTESLNAIGLLSLDLADFEALEHAHKESAALFTRIVSLGVVFGVWVVGWAVVLRVGWERFVAVRVGP